VYRRGGHYPPTPLPPLRRNDCNYVAGSVPFSYQSSGSNNTSGELFFNSAAQVYILFFYRAATFKSSGERMARYQGVVHHFHAKDQAPTTPEESYSLTLLHK